MKGARGGWHRPAGQAGAARTSRSIILGLPGDESRERESGRVKRGREVPARVARSRGGGWHSPASRCSWGPGGGWGHTNTPRGLPVGRGGEGRAGRGWHGGHGSTRTPTHLLSLGSLLALPEESGDGHQGGSPVPPTHRGAPARPPTPPAPSRTYRLPAGAGEPPLPLGALRGRGR